MASRIDFNGPGADRSMVNLFEISDPDGTGTIMFPAGLAQGGLIATLADPFALAGASTFDTYGALPPQLALAGSAIVKGSAPAVAGTSYVIGVRATAADQSQCVGLAIAVRAT